jgi:putative tryptophan/tyrosine transport system substrate-binding protein
MTKSKIRRRSAPMMTILLIVAILTVSACSPSQSKMVTIGMLNLSTALQPALDGFKARMTELGYIEGKTVRYVYEGPTGTVDKLKPAAEALMGPEIDLIVAISTPGIATLKELTKGTSKQVIFIAIFDPLSSGFVSSYSQPGGNLTGSRGGIVEPKRLDWFLRVAPKVKKLYAPFSPNDGSSKLAREMNVKAAERLGVEFIFKEVADPAAITEAAQNIPADADAIYILPDSQVVARVNDFIAAALARKIPLTAPNAPHAKSGALLSYGFDFVAAGRQAARQADQMLKGVKAADLPVETAEFFLSINVATADAIGLGISDDLLQQADTIYRELPPPPTAAATQSATQASTQAATVAATQAMSDASSTAATPEATKDGF